MKARGRESQKLVAAVVGGVAVALVARAAFPIQPVPAVAGPTIRSSDPRAAAKPLAAGQFYNPNQAESSPDAGHSLSSTRRRSEGHRADGPRAPTPARPSDGLLGGRFAASPEALEEQAELEAAIFDDVLVDLSVADALELASPACWPPALYSAARAAPPVDPLGILFTQPVDVAAMPPDLLAELAWIDRALVEAHRSLVGGPDQLVARRAVLLVELGCAVDESSPGAYCEFRARLALAMNYPDEELCR